MRSGLIKIHFHFFSNFDSIASKIPFDKMASKTAKRREDFSVEKSCTTVKLKKIVWCNNMGTVISSNNNLSYLSIMLFLPKRIIQNLLQILSIKFFQISLQPKIGPLRRKKMFCNTPGIKEHKILFLLFVG